MARFQDRVAIGPYGPWYAVGPVAKGASTEWQAPGRSQSTRRPPFAEGVALLPAAHRWRIALIEAVLLTVTRVSTFMGGRLLTHASGFFYSRGEQLFLVTSRHVVADEPSGHLPDRLEIELHTNAEHLSESVAFSIPLYQDRRSVWRQGGDAGGNIDVAVIELDHAALPANAVYCSFDSRHLQQDLQTVEIGTPLVVVGFPLGFHDTLHHLPVVRVAAVASSFGLRFQGQGYFLTDARTHRGTSGAPVLMRMARASEGAAEPLPWMLLGVHSARLDMGGRNLLLDESLGLNCAWYADILQTLTGPREV
jgi:S1-C subfamily serine protease